MPTMQTKLVASLVDRISAPAMKASQALRGIANSTNVKVGGVFNKINRELGYTNRALDNMRGRMVDAVAQAYVLKNALQAPIQAAIDFETTLTDISQKSDKSRDQMKEFGRYVRDLAPATNKTALELAKAQDVLVDMGMEFETAKKALPLMGKAATAYRVEIADAAKMSMAFVNNLKIKINELPDAFDRASAAGKAGAVELKDMAQYMPAIAAIAQSKGMTGQKAVLQLATALQITRKGAGEAAEAATNLRNVFQKMTSSETMKKFGDQALIMDQLSGKLKMPKDKKAAKAIEKYYESQWLKAQLELRQKRGLSPLEAFVDVTRVMLARNKGSSIGDFFTDMQVQLGMASLIQNFGEWQKIMKDVEATYKGGTERDYAERLNDLAQKVGGLNAAWETFKITIGGTIGPILVPLLQNLTQLAGRLADLAEKFPQVTRYATIGAAALIGFKIAATTAAWAGLSLKSAALAALVAFNPWTAALAAVAGAVALVVTNWDALKSVMPNTVAVISAGVDKIKALFSSSEWFEIGKRWFGSLWEGAKSFFGSILSGIDGFMGHVRHALGIGTSVSDTFARMRTLGGSGGSVSSPAGGGSSPRGSGNSTPSSRAGGATPHIAAGGLLDRIARAEGTAGRGDYNTVLGYGRYGRPNKPLTDMTLAEAFAFGRQVKAKHGSSSALGRYQIVGNTMKIAMERLGLKWSDKFSAANQDAMARVIYKTQGLGAWEGFKRHARRAGGGPVHAGRSYVVGEQGWEIFKPRQSGEIVNQKQLAAGGGKQGGPQIGHVSVTVHAHGGNSQEVAREVERVLSNKVRSIFRGSHSDLGFAAT